MVDEPLKLKPVTFAPFRFSTTLLCWIPTDELTMKVIVFDGWNRPVPSGLKLPTNAGDSR